MRKQVVDNDVTAWANNFLVRARRHPARPRQGGASRSSALTSPYDRTTQAGCSAVALAMIAVISSASAGPTVPQCRP